MASLASLQQAGSALQPAAGTGRLSRLHPRCSPCAAPRRSSFGGRRAGLGLTTPRAVEFDSDTVVAVAAAVAGGVFGIGVPVLFTMSERRDKARIEAIRERNRATLKATGETMSEARCRRTWAGCGEHPFPWPRMPWLGFHPTKLLPLTRDAQEEIAALRPNRYLDRRCGSPHLSAARLSHISSQRVCGRRLEQTAQACELAIGDAVSVLAASVLVLAVTMVDNSLLRRHGSADPVAVLRCLSVINVDRVARQTCLAFLNSSSASARLLCPPGQAAPPTRPRRPSPSVRPRRALPPGEVLYMNSLGEAGRAKRENRPDDRHVVRVLCQRR